MKVYSPSGHETRCCMANKVQKAHHQRPGNRHAKQREKNTFAITQQIDDFFASDQRQTGERKTVHANNPSSLPISFTKASSRLSSPVAASTSCGVPANTARPLLMITIRSHNAATSCMMWLEKSTHLPCALRPRIRWRMLRVDMMSRPLVCGSYRKSVANNVCYGFSWYCMPWRYCNIYWSGGYFLELATW